MLGLGLGLVGWLVGGNAAPWKLRHPPARPPWVLPRLHGGRCGGGVFTRGRSGDVVSLGFQGLSWDVSRRKIW